MENQIAEDQKTTKKIPAITEQNELDYVQMKYEEALQAMLKSPTVENVQTFTEANRRLYETQDAYRLPQKFKLQYRSRELHRV